MLTASSRGLAIARLFSVVRFLVSPQAQFVLSTLLVVHWSQLVACNAGTAWCGRTAVGLIVTPTACRGTRLVFDRENILWCGSSPALYSRSKSKRTQACTSGCTGGADISRACPTKLKLKTITSKSVLHPPVEATTRWRASQSFMIPL